MSKGPIYNQVLAPWLRSVANWVLLRFARPQTQCSITLFLRTSGGVNSVLRHSVPPHLGGVISLRSTANSVLRHFVPPHFGGHDLASLDRELGAPSPRSSAPRGVLPRFAQSLGGRSIASLSRWGDAQSPLGSTHYWGHHIVKWACTPSLKRVY